MFARSPIPVPVTGNQPTRLSHDGKTPFQPKDLGWLNPCDEHRDEAAALFA
ncbi:integrase [Rhizobium rhizogenes]|uniref:Integrase n=1 Tax=Rhizobium rhizogenes TaxID=359 RepID=A0A546XEY1_RHIRH|nr:integrase [Rhizobium rhizogenes]